MKTIESRSVMESFGFDYLASDEIIDVGGGDCRLCFILGCDKGQSDNGSHNGNGNGSGNGNQIPSLPILSGNGDGCTLG